MRFDFNLQHKTSKEASEDSGDVFGIISVKKSTYSNYIFRFDFDAEFVQIEKNCHGICCFFTDPELFSMFFCVNPGGKQQILRRMRRFLLFPRHPLSPPNDSGIPKHKLYVFWGGLGYVPGCCFRIFGTHWNPLRLTSHSPW